MVFVLPSHRNFLNLGGERLFFCLTSLNADRRAPCGLGGASGDEAGLQDAPGLGEPPGPLALDPEGGLGGLREGWELVLGIGEGLWGLGRSLGLGEGPWVRGGSQGFCGVPTLFPRDPPFAGDQPDPILHGNRVDKELAPILSGPGRAAGLWHHQEMHRRARESSWWPGPSMGWSLSPRPGLLGMAGDEVPNRRFPQSVRGSPGPGPGFGQEHRGVSGCPQPCGNGAKINLIWGNHRPNPSGWQASLWLASTHGRAGGRSGGFSSG